MSMIKALFFFAIVLVLGMAFAWLADRPGDMIINWQGQQIEMSLMVAVSLVMGLIVSVMFSWWVIQLILNSPHIMSKFMKTRRKDRGYKALSQGLIAAGSGDALQAKKLNKQSKSLLGKDQEPLIQLLDVQTAMIEGRHEDVRKVLEDMAEVPETATLGLRGLYLEAKRLGAEEAARQYAIKAADNAPHLEWAGTAAIEYHAKEGDWDNAIRRLEKARTAGVIAPDIAKRKKAILLTGRAMSYPDGELNKIADDASSALTLAPDLVPAALLAAKAHFQLGQLRRGARLLEKIWRNKPHPQVADVYVAARVGDGAVDRLKRAKKLESLKLNHVESHVIVAKMALEARDFKLARQKIEAAARLEPRESIYLLLADIEEADTGDETRVRYWLAHALRAARDPQWTADGYISEKWAPFSPVTGQLDAFEWKVPLATLQGPLMDSEGNAEPNPQQPNNFEAAMAALPAQGQMSQTSDDKNEPTEIIKTETATVTEAESAIIVEPETTAEKPDENSTETSAEMAEDGTKDSDMKDDEAAKAKELEKRLTGPIDDPGVTDTSKEAEKNGPFRLF